MELLNKIYQGAHIKHGRFFLGDEKGGPSWGKATLLATSSKIVLWTKVLESPRNGMGMILLALVNRQIGSSSFSCSWTDVAVELVLRWLTEANLTAVGIVEEISENWSERKTRIQRNQEESGTGLVGRSSGKHVPLGAMHHNSLEKRTWVGWGREMSVRPETQSNAHTATCEHLKQMWLLRLNPQLIM